MSASDSCYPRHPGRNADPDQPPTRERAGTTGPKRWVAEARVSQARTGKASGWQDVKLTLHGPTEAAALAARHAWIQEYLHPKPKRSKAQMLEGGSSCGNATSNLCAPCDPRPKRAAAPDSFVEKKVHAPYEPRAGPGRGHTYESTMPIEQQIVLPPVDAEQGAVEAYEMECVSVRLAPDVVQIIFSYLNTSRSLSNGMRVCREWAVIGRPLFEMCVVSESLDSVLEKVCCHAVAEEQRAIESARQAAEAAYEAALRFQIAQIHVARANKLVGRTILHRHDVDTEREGVEVLHVLSYRRMQHLRCALRIELLTPHLWNHGARCSSVSRLNPGLWTDCELVVDDTTFEDAMCECVDVQGNACIFCTQQLGQDMPAKWNWCMVARNDAPQRGVVLKLCTV